MAQSSRTFRIFVSSTFSDLKTERNALQDKGFTRLRDLAAAGWFSQLRTAEYGFLSG